MELKKRFFLSLGTDLKISVTSKGLFAELVNATALNAFTRKANYQLLQRHHPQDQKAELPPFLDKRARFQYLKEPILAPWPLLTYLAILSTVITFSGRPASENFVFSNFA